MRRKKPKLLSVTEFDEKWDEFKKRGTKYPNGKKTKEVEKILREDDKKTTDILK